MARPLFVVGRNRSGTKWLSNTIANHPDVACVQRKGAGGILEADILSKAPQVFGPLSIDENYLGFLACFSQSNFFRATGLDRGDLYCPAARTYSAYFRYIMDRYAEKEGKPFWLQKASVRAFETLIREFPDARFIVIEREVVANIRSKMSVPNVLNPDRSNVLRALTAYWADHSDASRFSHRSNVMPVTYEQFRSDRENLLRRISDFTGLTFHKAMLEDRWPRNTSFATETARQQALTGRQERLIRWLSPLLKRVPNVLWGLVRLSRRRRGKSRFVRGSFALVRSEYGWPEKPEEEPDAATK